MYDYSLVERSFQLKERGFTDKAIADQLKVSIRAVRHWRYGTRQRLPPAQRTHRHNEDRYPSCARCNGSEVPGRPYAYLLGLYLGDGHIIDKKQQHTLGISCTDGWPGLMDACEEAMQAVMPHNKIWRRKRVGCHDVMSSSIHWKCLFPQHGHGTEARARDQSSKRGSRTLLMNSRRSSSAGSSIPTGAGCLTAR